jgi:hypothetical protein
MECSPVAMYILPSATTGVGKNIQVPVAVSNPELPALKYQTILPLLWLNA